MLWFPSTRRERGGGKKERRESTHTYARTHARVYACARERVARCVCTGRKRTYVQKESREARMRETETERERGEAKETGRRIVCMYHQKSVPGY